MLQFERRVVASLVSGLDTDGRSAVEDYVDERLRAMPEHIRAGVMVESVLLSAYARVRGGDDLGFVVDSPIGLVRQYVRLLRTLTLFAEHELAPAGARP